MTSDPTPTPAPTTPTPLDLTPYLRQLAESVGYQVDWDELDPACANHPPLVTSWVGAAARHAGLAHARSLLAGPAAYLREQVGAGDFDDTTGCEVAMLFGLHEHKEQLEAATNRAAAEFTTYCQQLAKAGTGLTWPKDQPDHPPTHPPTHQPAGMIADPPAPRPEGTPVEQTGDAPGTDAHTPQPTRYG